MSTFLLWWFPNIWWDCLGTPQNSNQSKKNVWTCSTGRCGKSVEVNLELDRRWIPSRFHVAGQELGRRWSSSGVHVDRSWTGGGVHDSGELGRVKEKLMTRSSSCWLLVVWLLLLFVVWFICLGIRRWCQSYLWFMRECDNMTSFDTLYRFTSTSTSQPLLYLDL